MRSPRSLVLDPELNPNSSRTFSTQLRQTSCLDLCIRQTAQQFKIGALSFASATPFHGRQGDLLSPTLNLIRAIHICNPMWFPWSEVLWLGQGLMTRTRTISNQGPTVEGVSWLFRIRGEGCNLLGFLLRYISLVSVFWSHGNLS